MTRVVVALEALARALGAAPALLRRLERAGLIVPLGRDRAGQVWVDAEARQKVERVQSLISAGYAERDIALVIGRIERAERVPLSEVLVLDGLAAAADAEPEVVRRWADAGLLSPWAVDEQGAPLFLRASIEAAKAFSALEALGLGDQLTAWARVLGGEGTAEEIGALHALVAGRLARVQLAARHLQKLLPRLQTRVPKPRRRFLTRAKDGTRRLRPR